MRSYNSFINKQKQDISKLLEFLVEKNKRFVLSPHAFKQDKRGIEFEWNSENIVDREANKYMDQFFCFWEAQGFSNIAKATEFLKDFELKKRISIISFSDSNSFKKLNKYLSQPCQYFTSLPNFRGLELIATESSRIIPGNVNLENISGNFGNLIGSVKINNSEITLSSKLNCIIGGRGSGKSLLLDAIAFNIDSPRLNKDRMNYIKTFDITVKNFSGSIIEKGNFSFDYYRQSYVSELFNSNNYYEKIEEQFGDELSLLKNIDVEKIKSENLTFFKSLIKPFKKNNELENISDFVDKYQLLIDKSFKNSLKKGDKSKAKTIDYEVIDNFSSKVLNCIPKELRKENNILEKIDALHAYVGLIGVF